MNLIHHPSFVVAVGLTGFVVCVLAAAVLSVIQLRRTGRIIERARALADTPAPVVLAPEPDWADGLWGWDG